MSPIAAVSQRLDAIEAKLGLPGADSQAGALGGDPAIRGASFGSLLTDTIGSGMAAAPQASLASLASTMGPATTFGAPANGGAGSAAVMAGMQHLGVPYLWGGTDAVNGFDCSGLVQDAYRQIGVAMPKWSRHQAEMGVEVSTIEQARPGDVLAFGEPVNHVALYVGNGQMLHAPRTGEVIKIEPIDRPIASIRRIVNDGFASSIGGGISAATPSATEAQYQPFFQQAGQANGIDPDLLAAVAAVESNFNPTAISPAGAQGLMQFMPGTAAELGVDPFDPASAASGAARYLRTNFDRFGSVELALAAYNAGPGAVQKHNGIPPYPETQNYVRKVMDEWKARS